MSRYPPSRQGNGDLFQSKAQAATGVGWQTAARTQSSVLRQMPTESQIRQTQILRLYALNCPAGVILAQAQLPLAGSDPDQPELRIGQSKNWSQTRFHLKMFGREVGESNMKPLAVILLHSPRA